MNAEKWKSASRLTIKLAEEAGKVAAAYLDVIDAVNETQRIHAKTAMMREIKHVQLIAATLLNLVENPPTDDNGNEVNI